MTNKGENGQSEMADRELRDKLKELDENDDIDVTPWEAHFIEYVAFQGKGPMSDTQRKITRKILDYYGYPC